MGAQRVDIRSSSSLGIRHKQAIACSAAIILDGLFDDVERRGQDAPVIAYQACWGAMCGAFFVSTRKQRSGALIIAQRGA
jgi:hypothetical protein